ncbi:AraC-like ligand-binding domain-containing protein [Streptomyces sp. NPDC001770]
MSALRAKPPRRVRILRTLEPEGERPAHSWAELVTTTCGPLEVRPSRADGFDGTIASGRFGAVQLASVRAEPHAVELTASRAGAVASGELSLTCVLDGEVRVEQDGTSAVARGGGLFSYDPTRPFTLRMRHPVHMMSVKFDHRLLGLSAGGEHMLRPAVWSGEEGSGALLAGLLRTTARHMTELDPVADQLGSSVASLVSAVCGERLADADGGPAAARRALLHRVQAHARARLDDPDLTPQQLARSHHVSIRYLQLLFQEERTSPAQWIRNERLERCREELRSPRSAHLTVANIAQRWGMHGASHFSRLFRDRYGVTPREWRRTALRPTG